MPLYEYICSNCRKEFEFLTKFNDPENKQCPSCSELTLVRKRSLPSFHLKGGGWYKDGYNTNSVTENKEVDSSKAPPPDKKTADPPPKVSQDTVSNKEPKPKSKEKQASGSI